MRLFTTPSKQMEVRMSEAYLEALTPSDHLDQWLFNVELECSGASLWPLEEVAIGGAVLKLSDLLTALRYADELRARLTPPAQVVGREG